ncbi:hypothetical protein SELMODRAFT_136264 [Selaginella moellendorffii]|uniref:DNA damage-binding protein 1 n=1 Tax=Selaginella moellendorffii TaxID=88036 RepID=D8TBQ0_SELML|nr:hypothetical protein SELMODRAFT_136264 [Selaginella moellendorffii]
MAVQDASAAEDDSEVLYLAKCLQKSSVVSHAVCGHIRSPLMLEVVFGKETALELVVLVEDGSVQPVCEQSVFGIIKDMKLLPWNEHRRAPYSQTYGKDLLVLLSDSGKLSFLTFSVDLHRFVAVSQIHLSHPGTSLRELGWLLAVDSRSRAVAVSAIEDLVAIFPTSVAAGENVVEKATAGNVANDAESTYGWGTIWSMAFVASPEESHQLLLAVILHRKGALSNELQVLLCDTNERSIHLGARYHPSGEPAIDFLTYGVVEMPAFPGFVLLLRLGEIVLVDARAIGTTTYPANLVAFSLLDFRDTVVDAEERPRPYYRAPDDEYGARAKLFISAWCWEPDSKGQARLAFSTGKGGIDVVTLSPDAASGRPTLVRDCQYKCSQCRLLLWTSDGFMTAMIEMGDGHVLKVEDGQLSFQSFVQNIAPILDFSLVDYYGEKQDQMFACCGGDEEGSVRIIRNGNSVEKLICTPPVYQGVSGIWTMRYRFKDPYHAFFLISFVEETRVLSVGLNFVDITDAVGFESQVNTLACGLVEDGWVAQVWRYEVKLCSPTKAAHPAGVSGSSPLSTTWRKPGYPISVGAVCRSRVILALARPGLLLMLGTTQTSAESFELVELQLCMMEAEISCISIPQGDISIPVPPTIAGLHAGNTVPAGVDLGNVCVVGTHKPSVELLSIVPGDKFAPFAVGQVSLITSVGTAVSGCIPQDVRLALFDRLYILAGLRNGMLLRYEWPEDTPSLVLSKPAELHLIAARRLGVSPVCLVPLEACALRADIIALSDRPWLLQMAKRISYTSISFQPSTHATPVCSKDCPKGIIFLADCSLHLVEMEQSRTLNVQKLRLGCTGRRVLYHPESGVLIVLRLLSEHRSDVCCIEPLSGAVLCVHPFGVGQIVKCMELMKLGDEQLLLVGTASDTRRAVMATGEAERQAFYFCVSNTGYFPSSSRGVLVVLYLDAPPPPSPHSPMSSPASESSGGASIVFQPDDYCFVPRANVGLPGPVNAVASYLGQYVLACAGNHLFCLGIASMDESPRRWKKLASIKTRFVITSISVRFTTIAVGDCRDGVLLFTYREDSKKLEPIRCDPMRRLVSDCTLVDVDTAVVVDRHGNFCALSTNEETEGNGSPEKNLEAHCWFHIGEVCTTVRKVRTSRFLCKDTSRECSVSCVIATTLLGSVFIFVRITGEEYSLLQALQRRLSFLPATAPVLGNDHARFRGQGRPAGVKEVLDGDLLEQFLELTSAEQVAVLKEPGPMVLRKSGGAYSPELQVERVLRLLEKIHHTVT